MNSFTENQSIYLLYCHKNPVTRLAVSTAFVSVASIGGALLCYYIYYSLTQSQTRHQKPERLLQCRDRLVVVSVSRNLPEAFEFAFTLTHTIIGNWDWDWDWELQSASNHPRLLLLT
jgi:hypothetical protein